MSRFRVSFSLRVIGALAFTVIPYGSALARVETSILTPSDAATGGFGFGAGVAVSGDYIVVGAPGVNAAYVFKHDGSAWTEQQRITPSTGTAGDSFGESVAIDGDLLVAGGPHLNIIFPNVGRAFVFRREGETWTEEGNLISSGSAVSDEFGRSVSVSGNRVVVGAYVDAGFAGAAYVFVWDGSAWVEQVRLTPADAESGTAFGISVSIEGDLLIVGASGDDSACPGDPTCFSGAAYIFREVAGSWIEEAKLISSDAARNNSFGGSVAIDGSFAVIGSFGNRSAYIFENDGKNWTEQIRLGASDVNDGFGFGTAVAMDGSRLLVGAAIRSVGSAFLFRNAAAPLVEFEKLVASDVGEDEFLGLRVDLQGRFAILGNDGCCGTAHVYDLGDLLPPPIPTVSAWGLGILALVILVAAKVFLDRRVKSRRRPRCVTAAVSFVAFTFLGTTTIRAQGPDLTAPHHPEHILVRFKPGTLEETRQLANAAVAATDLFSFRYISGLYLVKVDPESLNTAIAAGWPKSFLDLGE